MANDVINRNWKAIGGTIRSWQEQRNNYRLERINSEREEFIETLQKRYGYTKEKATSELHKHYLKVRHR